MKLSYKLLALTLAALGMMTDHARALIMIDTVPVGNAGNAADQNYFGQGAYGAVSYDYAIGKYEVTLNQYTSFLNAVGATDTYSLYNIAMSMSRTAAGIARNGVSGGYTYSVIGSGNRPVTFVNWYDSARFVNWLHNGQPSGAQTAGTTETGAYTLNGALSGIILRNANARYGLPSEDEWYKAAYHQPVGQGGDSDDYWLYPTASNVIPNSRNGSASDANSANFYRDDGIVNGYNGGYPVNDSIFLPTGGALTDAGAFSLADSYYGTFDQGGNVAEWNDAVNGPARGVRGGSWDNMTPRAGLDLSGSFRGFANPAGAESDFIGFRTSSSSPNQPLADCWRWEYPCWFGNNGALRNAQRQICYPILVQQISKILCISSRPILLKEDVS